MKPRARSHRAKPPRAARRLERPRRRRSSRRALWLVAAASALAVGTLGLLLWLWGRDGGQRPQAPSFVRVVLPSGDAERVAEQLEAQGLISDRLAFYWYQRLFLPAAVFEPGAHLLPLEASPREFVRLLARHRSRGRLKVLIAEGMDSFQIAERLEQTGICAREDFQRAALDEAEARAEVGAPSFEGYLHPAVYEFGFNTDAVEVRRRMVEQAKRRFRAVFDAHAAALREWTTAFGFDEHELVTLASVVQKETASAAEAGTIASVFRNRLSSETFRPRGVLQSDPTAGYGCKLPAAPPSCDGFAGAITPALLKDPRNRYNTYRHSGLPPGPVCNPDSEVLGQVLAAPDTDFFYFFAVAGGRHVFSRSFDEHRAAVSRGRTGH